MAGEKEFAELQEYINKLKTIKSDLLRIIKEEDNETISKAAKYYPQKVNQLLMQRNILSGRGCFPFIDLAFLLHRKQNLDLINLNTGTEDIDILRDVIRRIDQELDDPNM